jgi:hypothetical protein
MVRDIVFQCRKCGDLAIPSCTCGAISVERLAATKQIWVIESESLDDFTTRYAWYDAEGNIQRLEAGPLLPAAKVYDVTYIDIQQLRKSKLYSEFLKNVYGVDI